MDSLIARLNDAGARSLVMGGQAVRLHGLPRFSMDWDLCVPPHDEGNLRVIERALGDELDVSLLPLGAGGQNLIQTDQTRFGVIWTHMSRLPGNGIPRLR